MEKLPEAFVKKIEEQFPNEFEQFLSALDNIPKTGILINPRKKNQPNGHSVLWNPFGKILNERPNFTADPNYHAGAYYAQEANSMFIHTLIEYAIGNNKPITALDLCAAPGGKSLLMNSSLHPESFCLSNEIVPNRLSILRENISKWGAINHLTIGSSPEKILFPSAFDLILVDAPCSGEGLFRRQPAYRQEWTEHLAHSCSIRQKDILKDAYRMLKPGGFLIYSTCTYAQAENEEIVDWLCEEFRLENTAIPIEKAWNIHETKTKNGVGYQMLPHLTPGEGFFCSLFQKGDDEATEIKLKSRNSHLSRPTKSQATELNNFIRTEIETRVDANGRVFTFPYHHPFFPLFEHNYPNANLGVQLGEFVRDIFVPHQSLANTQLFNEQVPQLEVSFDQAQAFLRGEALAAASTRGHHLVTFQNQPLGWVKSVGNRCNNMYPKPWYVKQNYSDLIS
jgi:16S rRNA C967 or C1407 C5-methylase (RsmB/RsmF family)/NOL1/NOP2/fmu family ribosome biogenesis protein